MSYDNLGLVGEIDEKKRELVKAAKLLRKSKEDLALAEREYKIAVTQKALMLRDSDMPVTLINLTIYGYREIAELRFKRDMAQAMVEANEEYINVTKLVLRLLEAQLNREWVGVVKE